MSRRLVRTLGLGIVLGLAFGLYYGWILRPNRQVTGEPDALRQDYKDDYVLMIAEAYSAGESLERSRTRLVELGYPEPGPAVASLAERLIAAGHDSADIRRLATLAAALGHTTPAIAPYLEGS
jgi:hypothetical protein